MKVRVVSQPPEETVTPQVPAHNPLAVAVPWPAGGAGFQTYVKVPLPPVAVSAMLPSQVFEQVGGVNAAVTRIGGGAGTVKEMVVSQPNASVTVSA